MYNMGTDFVNNHVNEKGYQRKLSCSERVFNSITVDCIREYKEHHTDRRASHVTQNEILDIIQTFYLESY